MRSEHFHFKTALFSLLLYEFAIVLLSLEGLSIAKIAVTCLVWVSFGMCFYVFFFNYKALKRVFPKHVYLIFMLLLCWNLLNIIRSFVTNQAPITTLLGNTGTTFALLIPFAHAFAVKSENLKIMQDFFLKVVKYGILGFLILFAATGGGFSDTQVVALWNIFRPSVFLIAIFPYLLKWDRFTVVVGSVALLYIALAYDNRMMFIREALLYMGMTLVYFSKRFRTKLALVFSFLILIMPFALLKTSFDTGTSPIETYFAGITDSDLSTDTRTFLYTELYADLKENNQLLIGKGANGRYYSEYFSSADGDAEYRLDMEVGVLAVFMKGGIIAVVLNLLIFISAIYLAFFKSRNYYVTSIGFMFLIYTVLYFIDNRIAYDSHDFTKWFFIGICLSKKFRSMTDREIRQLIH